MTYRERLNSVRQECKDYIEMYMEEFGKFECPEELYENYNDEVCYYLTSMRIEDGKGLVLGVYDSMEERDFDLDDIFTDNLAEICDAMVNTKKVWK